MIKYNKMDDSRTEYIHTENTTDASPLIGKAQDMQNALDAYGLGQLVPIGIDENTFAKIDEKLTGGVPICTVADETAAELRRTYANYQSDPTIKNRQDLAKKQLIARALQLRQSGFVGKSLKLQEMRALLHQLLKDKVPIESIISQIGTIKRETGTQITYREKNAENDYNLKFIREKIATEAINSEKRPYYIPISTESPEEKNVPPDTYVVKKN